jgi:hypothetical protein
MMIASFLDYGGSNDGLVGPASCLISREPFLHDFTCLMIVLGERCSRR